MPYAQCGQFSDCATTGPPQWAQRTSAIKRNEGGEEPFRTASVASFSERAERYQSMRRSSRPKVRASTRGATPCPVASVLANLRRIMEIETHAPLDPALVARESELTAWLVARGRLAIGFSGGVD